MSAISYSIFLLVISFLLTMIWAPPFIDFLYKKGFRRDQEKHRLVYRFIQQEKTGMPSMGGLLIILTVLILSLLFIPLSRELILLLLTLVSFGLLGLVDDLKTIVPSVNKYWGLRRRHILLVQVSLSLLVGFLLFRYFSFESITLPIINLTVRLGWLYIFWATFWIVATSNAFNITDGIDGLSSGLLIIALSAFLVICFKMGNLTLASFLNIWMGSLFVYLYFNIFPARFMMGDVGAQPFGAMLAVVALLLGHSLVLPIIGAVFFVEAGSSAIQMLSRKFRKGKKVWTIAPLHYHFQVRRWSEGKICMRFWLFGALSAFLGLMIALWV